jgi:ATP-dependent DNA helicase RecG
LDALSTVKGIGPSTLLKLHQQGIHSLHDLVMTTPKRISTHEISTLDTAILGVTTTLKATVLLDATVAFLRKRLTKLHVRVRVETQEFQVVIFNREFLKPTLKSGCEIVITGRFEINFKHFSATDIVLAKHYQEGFIPEYGLVGISDKLFRKYIGEGLQHLSLKESLPLGLISTPEILSIQEYLRKLHFPISKLDMDQAIRRAKYAELLAFGIHIENIKAKQKAVTRNPRKVDLSLVKAVIASLPYELTNEQKEAVNDIFKDYKKPHPMNRLLQGDVGSGKTIVSLLAALGVCSAKEQVVLMAPTEVLAKQHKSLFDKVLSSFGIEVAFLSSSIKGKQRSILLEQIRLGSKSIIIGTHAVFQEEIMFSHLGLIIIDEQHRFGVDERLKLRQKSLMPDLLFMSATPIPRTLAISLYADMDVTTIKEMPFGKKAISTFVADYSKMNEVLDVIKQRLEKQEQVYVIAPAIFQKNAGDVASVEQTIQFLSTELPRDILIEGLHGQCSFDDKMAIIDRFSRNVIQVLVATTVVEVGVDVPNATVMVILDAHHFGLSQLHQLRGRIGRGKKSGICYLVTDQILLGENRFSILEKSLDGFEISEEDLRLRGPGEILGTKQTGIPLFKMANFIEDQDLFANALVDAQRIVRSSDKESIEFQKTLRSFDEITTLD